MRIRFAIAAAYAAMSLLVLPALAADEPGVSATEIKIGGIFPFSGPASSIGLVGKGVSAYVQSINDRGGINGRRINYIAMDDAYSPPKAVEHARRLVESDEVSFIFSQLGTPGNSATAKYLKGKGVPSIAVVSGSSKFTDIAEYPLITTGLVSYAKRNLQEPPTQVATVNSCALPNHLVSSRKDASYLLSSPRRTTCEALRELISQRNWRISSAG